MPIKFYYNKRMKAEEIFSRLLYPKVHLESYLIRFLLIRGKTPILWIVIIYGEYKL